MRVVAAGEMFAGARYFGLEELPLLVGWCGGGVIGASFVSKSQLLLPGERNNSGCCWRYETTFTSRGRVQCESCLAAEVVPSPLPN
jgi:hypothetical protein